MTLCQPVARASTRHAVPPFAPAEVALSQVVVRLRSALASVLGAGVLLTALGAGAVSPGCSRPHPPKTTADVQPGSLDPAGDWSGVFYSPLFGHLHLVKEGNSVSGKWRTTNGDKWGELHGEVTGDLLKYHWVEHKIGSVGPSATTEGRGYFQYFVPPGENVNHEIVGQWGLGRSEIGSPWKALRQRGMLPDLSSVGPDETERVDLADEWDAPAAPPGGGQ